MKSLTLQAYWNSIWHDAGTILFPKPERGLSGPIQFYYFADYIDSALEFRNAPGFIDERAIGVNIVGDFTSHYSDLSVPAVLRDIIPQGAGRRFLVSYWGMNRDPGEALDFRLLAEGCVSPIGNLRIKEANNAVLDSVSKTMPVSITQDDVANRNSELIEYAQSAGVAFCGAIGAGGDAPKMLLVENDRGDYFFEGALSDDAIVRHWLVKFPRGETQDDRDVLRGEFAVYKALEAIGANAIKGARLIEGKIPSLWLPRFDREKTKGRVSRLGIESMYSLLGSVGDGARQIHTDVLKRLLALPISHDDHADDVLVEYLFRDVINTTIGNSDNHGRNAALVKRNGHISLAPAFDLAPMVLDPEGIVRRTVWPPDYQTRSGVSYLKVIEALARAPEETADKFLAAVDSLSLFQSLVSKFGMPERALQHPGVQLNHFENVSFAFREDVDRGARTAGG